METNMINVFEMLVERLSSVEIQLKNAERNLCNTHDFKTKITLIIDEKPISVGSEEYDYHEEYDFHDKWLNGVQITLNKAENIHLPKFMRNAVISRDSDFMQFLNSIFKEKCEDVINLLDKSWNITKDWGEDINNDNNNKQIRDILPNVKFNRHVDSYIFLKYAQKLDLVDYYHEGCEPCLYYDKYSDLYSVITEKVVPFCKLFEIDFVEMDITKYGGDTYRIVEEIVYKHIHIPSNDKNMCKRLQNTIEKAIKSFKKDKRVNRFPSLLRTGDNASETYEDLRQIETLVNELRSIINSN